MYRILNGFDSDVLEETVYKSRKKSVDVSRDNFSPHQ